MTTETVTLSMTRKAHDFLLGDVPDILAIAKAKAEKVTHSVECITLVKLPPALAHELRNYLPRSLFPQTNLTTCAQINP